MKIFMAFERPNLVALDCSLNVYIENIRLDIDFLIEADGKGTFDRYMEYSLGEEYNTISIEDSTSYNLTIDLRERIVMNLNENPVIFGNNGYYKSEKEQRVLISISNNNCFIFSSSESFIQHGLQDSDVRTEKPVYTEMAEQGTDEPQQKITMYLCKNPEFRDCVSEELRLGEHWNVFQVKSFKIIGVSTNGAVVMTSDNGRTYHVTENVIADSDLSDGAAQYGIYLKADGASSIESIQYAEYQVPEKPNQQDEDATQKPPPKKITESGEAVDEEVEPTEYKDVPELEEAIEQNTLKFEEKTNIMSGEKKVKIYKPKFKGTKVPIKKFKEKATQYESKRSESNLFGFLTYNGFVDVGISKSDKKNKKKSDSDQTEPTVTETVTVNEEEMIESIKAFQKYNGFPETGEVTETQNKLLTSPRCGNRDTSYKDEIETFTCVEGLSEGIWSNETRRSREICELDHDNVLDMCARFPHDYAEAKEIQDFVWNREYYFETDVEFDPTGKDVSHIGIAFNYEDVETEADFLVVRHERSNNLLRFRYGSYKQGVRTLERQSTSVRLNDDQKALRQFKLRITVRKGASSLAVDGTRQSRFQTKENTTSSVVVFTLG